MELHASQVDDSLIVRRFADEVRVEMVRKRVTATDLAHELKVSAHTIGSRLSGRRPFNAIEMIRVARLLGIEVTVLWERAAAAPATVEAVAS
ncbi:MAG: hypothetical protein LBE05_05935 [Microbacterium sp.]|jgi:ribosome-binding protein aMBF1 (putative translation factor)|nr:hypothetical protein [Microbacterium sp.]